MHIDLVPAELVDKAVLRNLLELYRYDFSEFTGDDVDEHGLYGYPYLDHYWTEEDGHPFLIRADGRIAGFAFVRSGARHDLAEFFIMRKYRRAGIGTVAARAVFERFPGRWQVRQMPTNTAATIFWRRAIPVAFDEHRGEEGTIQVFEIPGAVSS